MFANFEQNNDNSPMEVLEQYQQLCEEVQSILIQESTLLKQKQLPSAELLQKKADLLPRLDAASQALKSVEKLSKEDKKFVQKIQQKLMKIFLLDRENEKLLLALQVPQQLMTSTGKVDSNSLKNLYAKN